jgi:solute carrier family 25 carnitine/acylcarnitine transporter 20/29
VAPLASCSTASSSPAPVRPHTRTPLLPTSPYITSFESIPRPFAGVASPILGYGALNALLFVSYNRTESALGRAFGINDRANDPRAGAVTWAAGAVAGLATWVVSTPTELVKCRAQLGSPSYRSLDVARQVWRTEGLRGMYLGGGVTALRDAVGYGFYFWTYALLTRGWAREGQGGGIYAEAGRVLFAGGLSGIATWVSIYPLDVIKTRVQAQAVEGVRPGITARLKRMGAWEVYKQARLEGRGVLFRGLSVCCLRAFLVNAVQWGVYEMVMFELGQGKWAKQSDIEVAL